MRDSVRRRLVVLVGGLALAILGAPGIAAAGPSSIHHLGGDVYEYDYTVSTGTGPFHDIGMHRIVQVRNGEPVAARDGVFLLHGDAWNFDAAFRGGVTPQTSIAVYLATEGIDVWGIDLAWTRVPVATRDFSFMHDWGLQRDIDDIEAGLRFARTTRARTGASDSRLGLLAWSRGGWIGYALLNEEAQRPPDQRQVGEFIPVDTYFKVDRDASRAEDCGFAQDIDHVLAAGIYDADDRVFSEVGRLAASAPDAPSHLFGPPFTNLQASLAFGTAAWRFGSLVTPWYHYVGGYFPADSTDSMPSGLRFTDVARWNGFLSSASSYEPLTLIRDTYAISCHAGVTGRFDDDLGAIKVPVLYMGAAGGFGSSGLATLRLLGSRDVTSHIVRTLAPGREKLDFGHVDLFYARDAQRLV